MGVRRRWRPVRDRLGRRGLAVAAAVVVALVVGGYFLFRPGTSVAQAQPLTYTVAKTTVKQSVSATGTLTAAKEADLSFGASGTVTKVLVSVGDKVKKGQVLAMIDPTSLRASYNAAQSSLTAAQTQYSDDAAAGAGSTQLASDSAQIASAKASLAQAADSLADAKLRATFAGTVASRALDVGDTVAGGSSGSSNGSSAGSGGSGGETSASTNSTSSSSSSSSSTSSSSAFVVIQPGHFVVTASVGASDISSVKKGMQVQLTPSDASTTLFGTVSAVSMVADSSTSGSATFPVTVDVTGTHTDLYAGTSVTVSIITKQISNVLVVPALALSSSNGKTYVQKVVGTKTVKTAVTVGQTYGGQTEITQGLSSGDKVQLATGGFTRTSTSGTGGTGTTGRGEGFGGGGFGGGEGFGRGGFGGNGGGNQ